MWKSVKPVLAKIFTSRKALAMLAGAIIWALAQAGVAFSEEGVLYLLGFIGTYILGQGIADHRKEGDLAIAASLGKSEPLSPPDPE